MSKPASKTPRKSTPVAAGSTARPADKRAALGYNAIEDTTRRRKPVKRTSPELLYLTGVKRQTANATVRDDRRSFTILAWVVRRHLDNVARFTPHIRTGSDEVDKVVRKLLYWHSMRNRFDALGRHGRDEFMRMFEACKVISGDVGALKTAGLKLQGIEGERFATPTGTGPIEKEYNSEKVTVSEDGIVKNADGTRRLFCLCKRSGTRGETLEYERLIPAEDIIFDAYWPERFDADRGVSPLLTALNEGADVRETWEWLVLKAKASALFGLAFTRTASDSPFPTTGEAASTVPASESASYTAQLAAGMKARGLINLDLDPGDEVKEIESRTPNAEVINFTRELVRSVLLALDIPFTMYDSLASSFSARIADRNEYEEACEWKREKNVGVLSEIYDGWCLPAWAEADLFKFGAILKKAKMSVEEVAAALRWIPASKPWLDRSGEMSGHILALAAGVTSIPRICSAYGDDAFEIAEEQKEYLAKCGVPILYAQGGQVPVNDLLREARNGSRENPAK